jgi:hypothetical protein
MFSPSIVFALRLLTQSFPSKAKSDFYEVLDIVFR